MWDTCALGSVKLLMTHGQLFAFNAESITKKLGHTKTQVKLLEFAKL